MEAGVKVAKCAVKNNCLFCAYHGNETIGDYGETYASHEVCAENNDCDDEGNLDKMFDYESEKDCCDLEFWKVLDADEKMQKLFEEDMVKDIDIHRKQSDWESYRYFIKKY